MIYFDNASTTKCTPTTLKTVQKYLTERFFNPSSLYHDALCVKEDLESARATILRRLKGEGRIIFTSGGTESDNIALLGSKKWSGSRVIISAAEHAAVYASAMELRQRGFEVVLAPVDSTGRVILSELKELLNEQTSLVSIIHVNNETGAVNDLKAIADAIKERAPRAFFHSDGVQAFGKIAVNARAFGIDAYSMSAHKIGAPKGSGALYIAKGKNLSPISFGGGQEGGLRPSTENVASIMSYAAAVEERYSELDADIARVAQINAYLRVKLAEIEGIKLISDENCSPYVLAFASEKVRGEVMQHALERKGILIGTGSACSSNKATRRIAEALKLKGKFMDGVMRLSFFKDNTLAEAEEFLTAFAEIYKELAQYGS